MGVSQAGIAFAPKENMEDISSIASKLCGEPVKQIEHPDVGQFDTRNRSDVMVQFFEKSCFICNDSLAWDFLEKPKSNITRTHLSLGSPEFFLIFCRYDSGDSYGYAFVENGSITRSRLQTNCQPRLPPLIEYGERKDIEHRWLAADHFIEEDDCPIEERQKIFYLGNREIMVPEHFLTSQILDEILLEKFGACPWSTGIEHSYKFFRREERNKPWWKVF